MARFIGTIKEYEKFIGPRIRNKVNTLTISERKDRQGICEFCKEKSELESAHKYGKGRKVLISETLKKYDKGSYYDVDLEKCETELMELHRPINEVFYFLCRECHKEYDNNEKPNTKSKEQEEGSTRNEQIRTTSSLNNNRPLLLFLPDEETFKNNLLKKKQANWMIFYADGREENGFWDAGNFMESSNLRSNIWSGYLRNWKNRGIIKAIFEVTSK